MTADQLARLLGNEWAVERDVAGARHNLARRLSLRLRHLIAGEILVTGTQLPAERSMAAAFGVSRPTVTAALDELRCLGLVRSRQGSGTWIAERGPEPDPVPAMAEIVHGGHGINLAAAAPADISGLDRLDIRLAELLSTSPAHGYDAVGLPQLRARIAARMTARGLRTDADDIVVTNGAHHALALVLGALTSPADSVVVEELTYGGFLDLLDVHRAAPVPVLRDADGTSPVALRRALRRSGARLVYLTPSIHAPTGTLTAPQCLRELAAVLDEHDAVVIADDTLADLRVGDPGPALADLCTRAQVVTIGSLSKAIWGGLRFGWIRAPHPLRAAILRHRAHVDLGTAIVVQQVALQVFRHLDELLAHRNAELRRKAAHLQRRLADAFPDWSIPLPDGGLSLWVRLPEPDASGFVDAAKAAGVHLMPGTVARADRGARDPHVRICFDRDLRILDEAVARLRTARPVPTADLSALGEIPHPAGGEA